MLKPNSFFRHLKRSLFQLLLEIQRLVFNILRIIINGNKKSLKATGKIRNFSPNNLPKNQKSHLKITKFFGKNFSHHNFKAKKSRQADFSREKNWFNYLWLRKQGRGTLSSRGFVLPTMTMVLLIFSLVVGSILWRTSQYNKDVIYERQAQVIYNTATPAVERAKTKLEFLFKRDYRFPNSIPSVATLQQFMLNESTSTTPYKANNGGGAYLDIYTLPGENRIDINGDSKVDNAWSYETDVDGDGTKELVAYSVLMNHQFPLEPPTGQKADFTLDSEDKDKAKKLVTRTGPLTIQNNSVSGVCGTTEGLKQLDGWYMINNASVRKNFQIDAVVINKDTSNKAIATLEMQQDRQLDRGNKWGVWFRYDLEVFPGPAFNWNGAMYTGGNLIWGQNDVDAKTPVFRNYLISAPSSCFYTEDASEIVMAQVEDEKGQILFQGQAIAGAPSPSKDNQFYKDKGTAYVDIYPGSKQAPSEGPPQTSAVEFKKNTDSIKDNYEENDKDGNKASSNYALDPIVLFTEDKSQSRYKDDTSNAQLRDPNWSDSTLAKRIINKLVNKPYVDDAYRADNRWGPKPTYTTLITVPNGKNGKAIDEYQDVLTQNDPPQNLPDNVGLDGYWERRARIEGLRIMVGQRLELGNPYGWVENKDPLYPPNTTIKNLNRQRRTLRDNLAAVQSTVVYHYENESNGTNDKDFPIATLATTVHNSTPTIRDKSTTFTTDSSTLLPKNINFLSGEATNGWEFIPPGANTTGFKALIDQTTDPLRIALNNLAHFAGDPDGAFPPKQEAKGSTIVHPYPYTTMWGDFSNLRRVLDLLDAGTSYDDLSIADKTTLHTAASDLGLLGYNIQNTYIQSGMDGGNNPGITALGNQVWQVINGPEADRIENTIKLSTIADNLSLANAPFLYNGQANDGELNLLSVPPKLNRPTDSTYYSQFYALFTSEQYIQAFMDSNGLGANKDERVAQAWQILAYLQIERDREFGFASSQGKGKWATFTYDDGKNIWTLPCDSSIFEDAFGSGGGLADKKAGLALAFCPKESKPKYPALYYLFPKRDHDQIGKNLSATDVYPDDLQPITEEYIGDKYIFDATTNPIKGINKDYTYKALYTDTDANGEEDAAELTAWLTQVALTPRKQTDWKLPSTTTDTTTDNKISIDGISRYTALLDKAFYDGRQLMQVRTIDVDLNLLRNGTVKSDRWLTNKGLVYAFREDAVREDAIARPASSTWSNCKTEAKLNSNTCVMNVNTPKDPPINSDTGVSTKPVDFYPDPDRRPNGFRLKNGTELKRTTTTAGISFISDNPIYIQGDFNRHKNASKTKLEEFTEALYIDPDDPKKDWSNYYTRSTLDTNFAFPATDDWRPTEILGDAVTILSKDFCDGTFEDGMENKNVTGSCPTGVNSSYLNSTLSKADPNSITTEDQWIRENSTSAVSNDLNYPIRVDRNAKILKSSEFNNYRTIKEGKDDTKPEDRHINIASDTQVNAILINGLVPSRLNQPYGGFHNFPRFLQYWKKGDTKQNLYIAGAFFQLNFSTYATAPFDQEDEARWEPDPSQPPVVGESIDFYDPPNRRWGYDVALQYVPASPIASRFINVGSPRSEFYEQKSAEDPYIMWLRCAYKDSTKTQRIDPHVTSSQCAAL